MTAVYSPEGVFLYDDGESDTDQSQFELNKRAETKQSPLASVTETFKNIATQFNPLLVGKAGQDAAKTLLISPLAAPASIVSSGLQHLNAMPGVALRRAQGDEEGAKRIEQSLPSPDDVNISYQKALAPQTQAGESFNEGLSKVMEASKLPHVWPMGPKGMMSNMVGLEERRPLMSPNDVRVLGAQGVNTAREISAIPTDFANWRDAHIVRESPVRGEGSTTFGGQLGQAAESLGDTMARREMQGLTPIPGLPAALQPDTKMYAVRPEGSRLNTFFPTVPPEAGNYQPRVNPVADIIATAAYIPTVDPVLDPTQVFDTARRQLEGPAVDSWQEFEAKKAEELYPDLDPRDRLNAVKVANYGDGTGNDYAKLEAQWFDEWRNSPEGIAAGAQRLNSTEDVSNMHKSAIKWLDTVFTNFIDKQWGTANNEVVKLAEKGLTVTPAEELINGSTTRPTNATQTERIAMGLDPQGSYAKTLRAASQKVEDLNRQLTELEQEKTRAGLAAQARGIRPAEDEAFVAASREVDRVSAAHDKAMTAWQNQQLAYKLETMADNSVVKRLASGAREDLVQHERQFYPTLEKTPGDESVYLLMSTQPALSTIASEFYQDVMSGKIKRDKMPNSVGQFVKKNAQARIMLENQAKTAEKERKEQFVAALMTRMEAIPESNKVGSIGVSVITKDLGLQNVKHEFSIATAVCDFCLGEGGSAKDGTRNLFSGKKQNYEPQVNPITGEPNPLARSPRMTYINDVMKDGGVMWIINEANTGLPEGAIHLKNLGNGTYNIAGVYGHNNGPIAPTHSSSIAAFMNKNADQINQVSETLRNHAHVRDMLNKSDRQAMKADYRLTEDEARIMSEEGTRFVSISDAKKVIEDFRQASGVYQRPEATAPALQAPPAPAPREVFQLQPFFDSVRRDVSAQVGDRVETIAYRISEFFNPNRDPEGYANALREAAQREPVGLVEISLNELAEEIDMHFQRQQIGEWEPDDQPGDRALALQRSTLADVIQQGDVNNLRAMAFAMRGDNPNEFWSYLPRVERDAAVEAINERIQAVEALAADFGIRAVTEDLYETERQPGGDVNLPGLEDTLTALRNGTIDHPAFQELPVALRRVAMNQVAEMLDERILPLREPVVDVDEEAALAAFDNADQVYDDADFRPADLAQEIFDDADGDRGELEGRIEQLREGAGDYAAINRLPDEYRELAMDRVAAQLSRLLIDDEARLMGQADEIADSIVNIFQGQVDEGDHLTTRDVNNLLDEFIQDEQGFLDSIGIDIDEYRALFNTDFGTDEVARRVRRWANDNLPQPNRRGPFQPGGASAVRGMPLGNLNITPSITAQSLKGPDTQPVSNFLQQVKSLTGTTKEGLATGLMAFENMEPSRRMTKAEFVRELLPSSYDIVSLQGSADDNAHYRDMAEEHVADEPESVLDQMDISDQYHDEILDVVVYDTLAFEDLSSGAKKALKKKNITDYDSLYVAHAEAFKAVVEAGMEYLADMDGTQVADEKGFTYARTQRLALDSMGDEYSEFGVTHPDQQGTYHHFTKAPEGLIGHVRGTYNPDGLEVKTTDADIFTTKPNSYVIEEIQSDAQKNSQQVAHLHQVHGVLFKAAIQKALESGADVVYLPTAKIIAAERPDVQGWEARPDDRGLTMQVPIRKDTTSKFKPIYDQAIVKEGLKPLLKIPGVTSKLVSDGDYHEISFTPEAKEHILNGPGQTIPGYAKGGTVQRPATLDDMKFALMMRRA